MTTPTYYHLKAADYPINFPDASDTCPVILDKHTYVDDWIFNKLYNIVKNIQSYLILHKEIIET